MLEDLFRNRLSPLQPVFPQAAWQGAAGDVSGMPAAGRVKHGVPPPRDSWPGPGRQQACRQPRLFVPRLLGAQTALPHGSTVPGAQSLCGAQPLPQIPAKPHRLGQQQAPWGTAGSFGEVGAQEARKEPEMKPHQPRRLVQEASRWQQHLALRSQNCWRWEQGSSCPTGPALGESTGTESNGISDNPKGPELLQQVSSQAPAQGMETSSTPCSR